MKVKIIKVLLILLMLSHSHSIFSQIKEIHFSKVPMSITAQIENYEINLQNKTLVIIYTKLYGFENKENTVKNDTLYIKNIDTLKKRFSKINFSKIPNKTKKGMDGITYNLTILFDDNTSKKYEAWGRYYKKSKLKKVYRIIKKQIQ